ncbi:MAG: hypothetical protein ACTSRU_20290 [Candidatus Hodarchaeales archaeon]
MSEEKTIPMRKIELEIPVEVYEWLSRVVAVDNGDINEFLQEELYGSLIGKMDMFKNVVELRKGASRIEEIIRNA